MRDLVIVGAGGHGRETQTIVDAMNVPEPTWKLLGFFDDRDVTDSLAHRDIAWLGEIDLIQHCSAEYIIGIGSSDLRASFDAQLSHFGLSAAVLVHPRALVASHNYLAPGVVIAAGATVTTEVSLGRHVHLNVNSVVSHGCAIGDYSTVSPGVLVNGDVQVGRNVLLGSGSIITRGVSIGDHAVVGAGSVVVRDVPSGATVKGIPARQ